MELYLHPPATMSSYHGLGQLCVVLTVFQLPGPHGGGGRGCCRKCLNIIEDDEWLALQCDGFMQHFLASYYILFIFPIFICSF